MERKRSFWVLASFQLSHRVFKHAPSLKPRQKPKNPRSERPHYLLKRSSSASITATLPLGEGELTTAALKQGQPIDFNIATDSGGQSAKPSAGRISAEAIKTF